MTIDYLVFKMKARIRLRFSMMMSVAVFFCLLRSPMVGAASAVYVESNASGPNEVALLIQEQDSSALSLVDTYVTGGKGYPEINGNQSHALASDGRHLYVTNAGDDTLSVFSIGSSGRLALLERVPSLGRHPVSVAIVHDSLIVLNQGSVDAGTPSNPTVQRFKITQQGKLIPLRGQYTYLPADVPVDVVGIRKAGFFSVVLGGGHRVETFRLVGDNAIARVGVQDGIFSPLGGAMGRLNPKKQVFTIADEIMPGLVSFTFKQHGRSTDLQQVIRPYLQDPCWAVSNANGSLVWSSAFATRTLSLFRWLDNGALLFVSDWVDEAGPGGLDLAINDKNSVLYWLRVDNVEDDSIPTRPFVDAFAINQRSNHGSAGLSLVSKAWLPESWSYAKATGLVAIPVSSGKP